MDMICPILHLLSVSEMLVLDSHVETYALISRLNESDIVISAIFDALRYPAHSIFNATRDIPIGLMGTNGHEHVGEVLDS